MKRLTDKQTDDYAEKEEVKQIEKRTDWHELPPASTKQTEQQTEKRLEERSEGATKGQLEEQTQERTRERVEKQSFFHVLARSL